MATNPHHSTETHEIGTMDTTEQQRTFGGFLRFMTWTAALAILTLIFMALVNA